jgi:phosphate transport system substrate-binding protein
MHDPPVTGRFISLRLMHAVILCSLVLASCDLAQEPTAPPVVARIAASPFLEPIAAAWVSTYTAAVGVPAFDLDPMPEEAGRAAAERGEVALMLTVEEPPPGWFAAPLGLDAIALVVHPSNSLRSFSLTELAGVFSGRISDWQTLGGPALAIQPVVPLPGDGLRKAFELEVMRGSPVSPNAWIAPTPAAVLALVAEEPGAIGYLALSQVRGDVRLTRVEGVLPGEATLADGRYLLALILLGIAPAEPTGPVRDWLAWLQATDLTAP